MTVHDAATQLVDRLKGVVYRQQDFNVKLQQIRSWLTEKEAVVKVSMIRKPSSLEESQRVVKDLAFTAVELEGWYAKVPCPIQTSSHLCDWLVLREEDNPIFEVANLMNGIPEQNKIGSSIVGCSHKGAQNMCYKEVEYVIL